MGFFSWNTQDTDRSIANSYSYKSTFRVVMTDHKGNKWVEHNYEGYGTFGGKDYYELLAEMNGLSSRDEGCDLAFKDSPSGTNPDCLHPNLSESIGWKWLNEIPKCCEFQGFFYQEEEQDEDDEDRFGRD